MSIRNAWFVAAWSEVVTTKPLARRICDLPVVLFRGFGGTAAALFYSCAHRGAPLSLETVVESGIRCNHHGVVFSCAGKCVEVPNQPVIPEKAKVQAFPLV